MPEVRADGAPNGSRLFRAAPADALAFVWAPWALVLLLAQGFVIRYGADVPRWDDFDVVPVLIGEQPITAGWLWSQHNDHRVPLPRLVLITAYRLLGHNFRAGMVCSVVALGLVAAGLVAAAGSGARGAG